MSLCPHGYTANWDCPICECPCGSGLAVGDCNCQGDPTVVAAARLPATMQDKEQELAAFAELVLTINAARSVA